MIYYKSCKRLHSFACSPYLSPWRKTHFCLARLFVIIMHAQDSIRDVEMNNFNKMEALSGGYCGKIFVTDISHFKADKLIDNGKYDAGNAISSVSWNPGCDCVSDGVGCA
jgi:hypothetical protein